MIAKNFVSGIVGASSLLMAAHASAAEPVKITTEIEVGAEYHFQLTNTNDGLKQDAAQVKETDFSTKAAKLSIRGKLTDQISWNLLYQADNNLLERFWLTNKVSDTLEVNIGKQKIKTYGWNRKLMVAWNSPIRPALQGFNPLTDKVAVEATYKWMGTWSLALAKDYFDASATCTAATPTACKSWNEYEVQKQPAIAFEWLGSFGDFQPLVQYARYDRNHSQTYSVGLRMKNDTLDGFVELVGDERNDKAVNVVTGKADNHKNKIQGVVLYSEFYTGTWTPYILASTTNLDEYTAPGGTEVKTNKDGAVNDNERLASVGVFYEGFTKVYRPYVAVASTMGKYVDPKVVTKEEGRSKTDFMVGLTGKF